MNKRDDLCMRISGKEPDIMLITEVLPKAQFNAIPPARFAIHRYKTYFSFAPDDPNLSIKSLVASASMFAILYPAPR